MGIIGLAVAIAIVVLATGAINEWRALVTDPNESLRRQLGLQLSA